MRFNKGNGVVMAAVGINLVIGVLYAWSIFNDVIKASIKSGGYNAFQWPLDSINDPYALCCAAFAFCMVPAGRLQDKLGSRKTALIGGLLGGVGFLVLANSVDYWAWMLGFGLLLGAGIGFAYAASTPAALSWFAPNKSALITGIVVSGFALASVYIAPLATYLVNDVGIHKAMLVFSAMFFVLIPLFAFCLASPPEGYVPLGFKERRSRDNDKTRNVFSHLEDEVATPMQALKDRRFWVLWILFLLGAGAGLMVIGNIKPLAKLSMGELAYIAIVILSIGDASGRILAGILSNKYGLRKVLSGAFLLQALLMLSAYYVSQSGSAFLIMLSATLIGISYGCNLVIFPNYVKDFWGMKYFGTIYGMLFTAWGVGGFAMIKIAEYLNVSTGTQLWSFSLAGLLIVLGFFATFAVDNRKDIERAALRKLGHH